MKDMYTLIIADDEFIIRQGLMSFKWEKFGFKVIGSASDGEEVLAIMKKKSADLIVTDIQMPIIDGLKLSALIREFYPSTKVIILTGYKNFEYAQKAISAGVFNYLLKPVDLTEMENLILKVKEELDEEASTTELIYNYERQLKGSKPLAIENFLRNILEEQLTDMLEIEEKMNLLEIYLNRPFYASAVFQIVMDEKKNTNMQIVQVKLLFSEILNEFFKYRNIGYFYFNSENNAVLLFNFEQPEASISTFGFLTAIVQEICTLLKETPIKNMVFTLHVGVGSVYNSISYLSTSYRQAILALQKRFFDESTEVFYTWEEDPINLQAKNYYPYEKENVLLDAVMDGKRNEIIVALNSFWNDLELVINQMDPNHFKNGIIQLLNMLERRLIQHGTSLKEIAGITISFTEYIDTISTITELKAITETVFIKSSEHILIMNGYAKSSSHNAVSQAVKYIKEHYNMKITLNDMAEKVYLNSSYLSVQFKKEMGINFIDYIKKVRIEKAKELLKRVDLKSYEVCEEVGYKDYKYFTELFKELTGLTPVEYRQKLITK